MSELIGIREAARRIGVSDTAVHKAIKSGRVTIAGRTEKSDRPLLAWPQVLEDWKANSDASKRHTVGPTGTSARRTKYTGGAAAAELPTARQAAEQPEPDDEAVGGDRLRPGMPSLAQAKAVRENYLARLAKLEYEQKVGKLVNADEIRLKAFNAARAARDALNTMEDRLAPILASLADLQEVRRVLRDDIRRTCERIATDIAKL